MNKFIVTTTISSPTIATEKFADFPDWQLIVVGDLKTPHEDYANIDCIYLHPDYQQSQYPELSDAIGWNCIQRRNIGFVEAYRRGADVVATVDDDNIPYENWGQKLFVGQTIDVHNYEPYIGIFDPLSITEYRYLWHRGYPIQFLQDRLLVDYKGIAKRKVLIQANLFDGDPDIDAIARLTFKPIVKFEASTKPYSSDCLSPFNSQNTILAREVLPFYAALPYVGRVDDIWGGYMTQRKFPHSLIYAEPTVYQDRNAQDLIKNLEDEIYGYRNTYKFVSGSYDMMFEMLPEKTKHFIQIYEKEYDKWA